MAQKYPRGREGVLASLFRTGDLIRIDMDEAESNRVELPKHWYVTTPYRSLEYDAENLLNMELSEKDFAMIGQSIVARLVDVYKAYED